MPRNKNYKCPSSWTYGTDAVGNLPQYKVGQNLCNVNIANITHPGVTIRSFRVYHVKCPYSIQAEQHFVRDVDINSSTYWQQQELGLLDLASHVDTDGIMIIEHRGPKHGFLCVDDACPYYLSTGKRYFYI